MTPLASVLMADCGHPIRAEAVRAPPMTPLANALMADRGHPIRAEAVRAPPMTPPGTHAALYGNTLPDRVPGTRQALPVQAALVRMPPVNRTRNAPPAAMKRPRCVPLLLMHLIRLTPMGEGPPALPDVT